MLSGSPKKKKEFEGSKRSRCFIKLHHEIIVMRLKSAWESQNIAIHSDNAVFMPWDQMLKWKQQVNHGRVKIRWNNTQKWKNKLFHLADFTIKSTHSQTQIKQGKNYFKKKTQWCKIFHICSFLLFLPFSGWWYDWGIWLKVKYISGIFLYLYLWLSQRSFFIQCLYCT